MHSLAAVDLNLIVALHALLEERSVSRAARRVGLSQPAMSHALARLREHFGDPLLVRTGRAMEPTPLAAALLTGVRPLIGGLEALLTATPVEPATLSLGLRLVTDDAVGLTFLPRLVARLRAEAPGVTLDVLPRGAPGRKALLRAGQADLALGAFSGAGMDLHRIALYSERWVTVLRRGHPAGLGPWTAERWAALPQVIVSPTGGRRGEVDRQLQERGLSRAVVAAVPHFSTALALVARTDLVLTTGEAQARALGPAFDLEIREPPLPMPPYEIAMLWHPRTEHDPAQRWLRALVQAVAEEDREAPRSEFGQSSPHPIQSASGEG